jgi:hypothetical protein
MNGKLLAFAAALVLVSSCASNSGGVWTKPGATQKDFDADRAGCLPAGQSGGQSAYDACMTGRGYTWQGSQPKAIAAAPTMAPSPSAMPTGTPPQFAEIMPTAMLEAAAMAPPPASVTTEAAQPIPPAPSGHIYGGHLASYYHEAEALRGWNIIVGQQSSIGSLKRHIVPIQTAKGPMVRLIAGDFTSNDEASRFCAWARQQRLYCQVMELGAGGTSAPVPAAAARPARSRARPRG